MTVPFTATQFMAYESLSRVMNPRKEYDPISHCVAGGLAGAFAAGITTPLDAIKTLLQTRGLSEQAEIRNVRGLLNAAAIIRRQYGWGGFFRGLKPRIITTMPSTAICWYVCPLSESITLNTLLSSFRSSYEMAKAYFKRQREAAADSYGAKVT
jgi:solute carrier family 25 (mitochondrial iron transporter), member 28/37